MPIKQKIKQKAKEVLEEKLKEKYDKMRQLERQSGVTEKSQKVGKEFSNLHKIYSKLI